MNHDSRQARDKKEREEVVIIILGEEPQGKFFFFNYESSVEIYCIFVCSKNPLVKDIVEY